MGLFLGFLLFISSPKWFINAWERAVSENPDSQCLEIQECEGEHGGISINPLRSCNILIFLKAK